MVNGDNLQMQIYILFSKNQEIQYNTESPDSIDTFNCEI